MSSQRRGYPHLRGCKSPKMGLRCGYADHCTFEAEKVLGEFAFLRGLYRARNGLVSRNPEGRLVHSQ